MKTVILAGGLGTRITEESHLRPKPMIEIGGKPIIWHIMKIYSTYGMNDFIVCLGYRGYIIKEYFANYFLHMSDVTIDIAGNRMDVHQHKAEPWRVTLVETGENTMTGGRLKQVRSYLGEEEFCFTYGDGLSDVDIRKLVAFHRSQGKLGTLVATQPQARYGALRLDGPNVAAFEEKPHGQDGWINGGYFVLSPKVIDYIAGDHTPWESEPMERLARDGQLAAYRYDGFWQAMDTLRDKNHLE